MRLFLKVIHKIILVGMPLVVYNPFTNKLNAPFNVKEYSTYLNFKLDNYQKDYLNAYIHQFTNNLSLTPVKISKTDKEDYYLSVNIYNCSSPLFLNNDVDVTRCEINTYVKDNNNNYGTIILDYNSNGFSLDPVDLFKFNQNTKMEKIDNVIKCIAKDEKIDLSINYNYLKTKKYSMDESLVKFTDNIFYKNGICEKLYYDSSLTTAVTISPIKFTDFKFKYKDLVFEKIHSIFYFKNDVNFICSLWDNLYSL